MKEALLKKRYGIPAALLLVLVLAFFGVAAAWYCFTTNISSETNVDEPLSAADSSGFETKMYPGETNTWTFIIHNKADVSYSVKADLTFNAPEGVSITSFTVGDTDETSDLTDGDSAEFDIAGNSDLSCSLTIKADKDAAPGEVSASFSLSRE